MAFIAQSIIEARIDKLIERRDNAIRNKDYSKVWVLNMKIDKNRNRLVSFSY